MKNILVLNYEFPPLGGGASPVSYEISKGYADLGYGVDVITMGYGNLPEYEEIKGMHVHRVRCLRTKKQVCHPWEQLTYLWSGYRKAKELLKTKKYDICHAHFIIPTGVLARKLKKEFGLEYIVTAHGSDVLGHNPRFSLLYKLLGRAWRDILNHAKLVVSPSRYLADKIQTVHGDLERVVVIPNGIGSGKFTPLKKEKYILVVSRLQKSKGIQDLLEAIRDMDLGEWKVKIVGEGPYGPELEKTARDSGLSDKVQFLGWVDNKSPEMRELYGKASVFCQPSYFENASIVLLEAMQSGCAVIARDVGGNPETIDAESLFDTTEDLRNTLRNLLGDHELLEVSEKRSLKKIEEFGWEKIILEYNRII